MHLRVYDIGLFHPARAAQVLPHLPWRQLPHPALGSSGTIAYPMAPAPESRLGGSLGAATRLVVPAPTSWHRAALKPSCVTWR
jgi:hypothetical protein